MGLRQFFALAAFAAALLLIWTSTFCFPGMALLRERARAHPGQWRAQPPGGPYVMHVSSAFLCFLPNCHAALLSLATNKLFKLRDLIGRRAISPSTWAAWVTPGALTVALGCFLQSVSSKAALTTQSLATFVARKECGKAGKHRKIATKKRHSAE